MRAYEPKKVQIEALEFVITEAGVNAAKKFCGANFTSQVVGKTKIPRYLLRMKGGGWIPVTHGDYIAKHGRDDFRVTKKDYFEQQWKPVKNDVPKED